jgi:hypothetical protein
MLDSGNRFQDTRMGHWKNWAHSSVFAFCALNKGLKQDYGRQ